MLENVPGPPRENEGGRGPSGSSARKPPVPKAASPVTPRSAKLQLPGTCALLMALRSEVGSVVKSCAGHAAATSTSAGSKRRVLSISKSSSFPDRIAGRAGELSSDFGSIYPGGSDCSHGYCGDMPLATGYRHYCAQVRTLDRQALRNTAQGLSALIATFQFSGNRRRRSRRARLQNG